MPQFIYGDSYGDVGNRALATDQASDARYFQMLAANRAAQEEANRVANQQANLGFQYNQLNATMGDAAAQRQQALLLHGDDEAYRNKALEQTSNLTDRQIQAQKDLETMRLTESTNRLDLGEQGRLHQEAYQAIQTGAVRTPDQLNAFLGGKLPAGDANRLHMVLQEANTERLKQYGSGNNAAEMLNQEYKRRVDDPYKSGYDTVQKQIAGAPAAADKYWGLIDWRTLKETLANSGPVSSYNMARSKFFEDLAKNKSYNDLTEFDPFANRFTNKVPRPDVGGVPSAPVTQPQAAAAPAGISAVVPPTTDNWVPWTPAGIKLQPGEDADIRLKASSFAPGQARSAFIQQRLRQAVQQGKAVPIPRPPAPQTVSPPPLFQVPVPQAPTGPSIWDEMYGGLGVAGRLAGRPQRAGVYAASKLGSGTGPTDADFWSGMAKTY